ncbi:biotin transporter BioY [Knoellia subterranea]|uniref:Biotin transporter n=1 Tax=Knoellia subterranea KCTC 19937 TaxID=1385521 RepID=A0A0A0JHG7_9MICO|nr:biotin transporter BioY [Knoellia subterranea]KGN36199.1 biotin biosynthesis protein BioC [Knoellia subterranea KCTC 19937]
MLKSRDLALIAIFTGIIAALGLIPAISPFGGAVPITAQSMGIMLAGAILGSKRGALSVLLFLALVAIGLPLLSGGRGGLGVFAGPSVGYLIGFPVAAFLVGLLTERVGRPYRLTLGTMANILGGVIALNAIGIVGMAIVLEVSLIKATTLAAAFMPGDLIKAVLTAFVAAGVHAAYPGLIPARAERNVAKGERVSV